MNLLLALILLGPADVGSDDYQTREWATLACSVRLTAAEVVKAAAAVPDDQPEARSRLAVVWRRVTVRELNARAASAGGWPEAYRISGWVQFKYYWEDDVVKPSQPEWWYPKPTVWVPADNTIPDDWMMTGRLEYDHDVQVEHAKRQLLAYLFRTGDRAYVEKVIKETPRE